MNTPVSFELAKLLKEKGFEEISSNFYTNPRCKMFGIDEHGRYYPIKNKAKSLWISGNAATLDSKHVYYAPTISDVVMWLYEKHNIWLYVDSHEFGKWCYNYKFNRPHELSSKITENGQFGLDDYNTPTEAYENAIKFVLENLI